MKKLYQQRVVRAKIFTALTFGAAVMLLCFVPAVLDGCANTEKNHKILSIFFDGVPPVGGVKPAPEPVNPEPDKLSATYVPPIPGVQMSLHQPFKERKCAKCHDTEKMGELLYPVPQLCFTCHDNFQEKYRYLHGPVATGSCVDCHSPHYARFKFLMNKTGREACFFCHEVSDLKPKEGHGLNDQNECTQCHNPHGSNVEMLLKK